MREFDLIILANFIEVNCDLNLSMRVAEFNNDQLYREFTTQKKREDHFLKELKKMRPESYIIPLKRND